MIIRLNPRTPSWFLDQLAGLERDNTWLPSSRAWHSQAKHRRPVRLVFIRRLLDAVG